MFRSIAGILFVTLATVSHAETIITCGDEKAAELKGSTFTINDEDKTISYTYHDLNDGELDKKGDDEQNPFILSRTQLAQLIYGSSNHWDGKVLAWSKNLIVFMNDDISDKYVDIKVFHLNRISGKLNSIELHSSLNEPNFQGGRMPNEIECHLYTGDLTKF